MGNTSTTNPNTDPSTAIPIAETVMENLAARFRPGGVMVCLLRPDGTMGWCDHAAGVFFQRFAIPLLQYGAGTVPQIAQRAGAIHHGSSVVVWGDFPGLAIAAFPFVEKKQVLGILVTVAKSHDFKLGEEVVRVCGQLGIDGIWLAQQADQLPSHGEEAIQRQARLLLSMLRDQVRLTSLEQELDALSGQLSNSYEELSLIYQLSGGMKVNRSAGDFFKQACLDVMEVISVRGMGVALRADSSQTYEPVLYGQISLPPGKVHRLADDLMPVLRERKSPLMIHNLPRDKTFAWLAEHAHQLLAVPLMRQDQLLGCMFGLDKTRGDFDTVDSKLLNSIANESAIYLENSMLYSDVRGLMMGLLHSLTSAVDAKDTYTCGHSERVALLSRHVAQRAGLSEQQVERVYMAGLLHDVGKIGVPEAVLQKPGRLDPEEFEQIKKHPEIGARILRDVKQIQDIIPGVLHHHERFDGKGYPHGLAGEAIPLMGRIICLADCFDAMTSSRTYRKALPLEVALTEIRRCAGTQFDPVLTDAFLAIDAETLRELMRNHQDQSRKLIDLTQRAAA